MGSGCVTPEAGELMEVGGVSGSQMPEQSYRELDLWWGPSAARQKPRLVEGAGDALEAEGEKEKQPPFSAV